MWMWVWKRCKRTIGQVLTDYRLIKEVGSWHDCYYPRGRWKKALSVIPFLTIGWDPIQQGWQPNIYPFFPLLTTATSQYLPFLSTDPTRSEDHSWHDHRRSRWPLYQGLRAHGGRRKTCIQESRPTWADLSNTHLEAYASVDQFPWK